MRAGPPTQRLYGFVEGAGVAGGVAGAIGDSPAGGAAGAIGDSEEGGAGGAGCSVAGCSTLTFVSPLWPYMK